MDDFKPQWFGQYELIQLLGVGGMAEVFLARVRGAKGFEKIVVVKRMLPKYSENPELVRLFVDEAKLTVQLQHNNIVKVMDFDEIDDQPFIVMEYVHGRDLFSLLRRAAQTRVKLPVDFCVHCISEMLRGLGYAHEARGINGQPLNILHRDVSPANIFIGFSGEVKLGDFGIAHRAGSVDPHEMRGKFSYLAPEALQGQNLDVRADNFSAGVVLWETLAGRRLFVGHNKAEILLSVRDKQPKPPSRYNPQISSDLDAIALKALRKSPDERFQSAQDFEDALADYLFARRMRWSRRRIAEVMQANFPEASQPLVLPKRIAAQVSENDEIKQHDDVNNNSDAEIFVEAATQPGTIQPTPLPANSGESSRWPESVDSVIVDVTDINLILKQKKQELENRQELLVHWAAGGQKAFKLEALLPLLQQDPQRIAGLGVIGEWQLQRNELAHLLLWDSLDALPEPKRAPDARMRLQKTSLVRLLFEMTLRRMTGLLRIRHADGQQQRLLYLDRGYPVYVYSTAPEDGAPALMAANQMLKLPILYRGFVQVLGDQMPLDQALISVSGEAGRDHIERIFSAIIRSRLYSAFAWEQAELEVFNGLRSDLKPSFKLPHLLGILVRAVRRSGSIAGMQPLFMSDVLHFDRNMHKLMANLRLRDEEKLIAHLVDGQLDVRAILQRARADNEERQKIALAVLQVLVETGIAKLG